MCSKIFFTLSVFFLSALLNHKNEVPDQVVLRTGKISITEYELEKNLQLFLAGFTREKGYKPTDTAIANWINSFIDSNDHVAFFH